MWPDQGAVATHPLESLLEVVHVTHAEITGLAHEVGSSLGVSRPARMVRGHGAAHHVVGEPAFHVPTV